MLQINLKPVKKLQKKVGEHEKIPTKFSNVSLAVNKGKENEEKRRNSSNYQINDISLPKQYFYRQKHYAVEWT